MILLSCNVSSFFLFIHCDTQYVVCLLTSVEQGDGPSAEEARLLSRYGVWLIVSLCAPTSDTPPEVLGRLLAALCHWYNATQYLPDGK